MRFDRWLLRESWHSLLVALAFLFALPHPASSLYVKKPQEMHNMTIRSMHDASRSSTTFNGDGDWDVMYEAFSKELPYNFCSSSSYNESFKALPAFDLSSLRLPPQTKIVFFGNSELHEVLQNIVVANKDILITKSPLWALEGTKLDTHKSDFIIGYHVQWDFTIGTTIVEIQNYEPMQIVDNVDALQKFMQENYFDVAFFMNPGPRCQFIEAKGDLCECLAQKKSDPFDCDQKYEGYFRGPRDDVSPLWDVFDEVMKGRVYEVEGWTNTPQTWFHADDQHTIRTNPILAGHACNTEGDLDPELKNCGDDVVLMGHQCQPGRVALISELVMAKAWSTRAGLNKQSAR